MLPPPRLPDIGPFSLCNSIFKHTLCPSQQSKSAFSKKKANKRLKETFYFELLNEKNNHSKNLSSLKNTVIRKFQKEASKKGRKSATTGLN